MSQTITVTNNLDKLFDLIYRVDETSEISTSLSKYWFLLIR